MRLGLGIAVALLFSTPAAQAQEWPRVNIFAGAQIADFGTDVELHESEVLGSTIDFEDVLGFHESATVAWVAGLWRISRRNQVEAVWTRVDRDIVQHQLPFDISFGGETFDGGTEVNASFDTWFIGASYRFAIVATPVVELGPLIGLVAINLSTGIGVPESDSGLGEEASFTAPAVLPGAFVNLRAHPRLMIRARVGYISADFGDIDGELVQVQAGADFMFNRWIGVGATYSYNKLSVGVDESDFRGDVRFSFSGPQIYAVVGF